LESLTFEVGKRRLSRKKPSQKKKAVKKNGGEKPSIRSLTGGGRNFGVTAPWGAPEKRRPKKNHFSKSPQTFPQMGKCKGGLFVISKKPPRSPFKKLPI